jgi:large subunit ribosomal protein L21
MTYAVIRTGGKQYRVSEGDRLRVEKLEAEVGAAVSLDEVLFIGGDGSADIGQPLLAGAKVTATVTAQDKARKILVYHKRRRTGYKKLQGHRQPFTELTITGVAR